MVYSQKNLTVRLILDTPDCPEAVLPISSLKMVKAIEYDPVHNFLYWVSYLEFTMVYSSQYLFCLKYE